MSRDSQAGEVRLFAGTFTPSDWRTCDGSQLDVSEAPELFKAIGTTYGGDGKTTFALPNFQAQVPIHVANGVKPGQVGKARITLPAHAANLRYIIALRPAPDYPMLGEIRNYAFAFAPAKWARCEGQLLPIGRYTALFSILGDTYGGDRARTFALPDLRGAAVGEDGLRCVATNFCIAVEGMYPFRG